MKGHALIYKTDGAIDSHEFHGGGPALEFLRNAVGGDIELVPGFDTIEVAGVPRYRVPCVAFCDENAKVRSDIRPEFNRVATKLWEEALGRSLRSPHDAGVWLDFLVGPVVVLYGDPEFMAEL
jgi:hypothetical protein